MKTMITALGVAAMPFFTAQIAIAQTSDRYESTQSQSTAQTNDATRNQSGSQMGDARNQAGTTTTTVTFTPETKTKVVKYFDTYKTQRYGLPPGIVAKINAQKLPATWRTTRIAPGVVIVEDQRDFLVEAPPDLVKVLPPPPSEDVRYFLAGSNVIAVNQQYKVVDSIQIPSIEFEVDD